MSNSNCITAALITALLSVSFRACANDGIGWLGVGGVITHGKSDAVVMRKEVLEIGTNRINVAYEFVNESDFDVTLPIVFPLPPYGGGDLPSPEYGGEPPGFSLVIDGLPRPFTTKVSAFLPISGKGKAKDVTALLTQIGLTPGQIALLPGAFRSKSEDLSRFDSGKGGVPRVTDAQLRKLKQLGLLIESPSSYEAGTYPNWSVQVSYHWTSNFPSRTPVTVSHSYAPFLGLGIAAGFYGRGSDANNFPKLFCAGPSLTKQLVDKTQSREMPGAVVSYILTTANTWSGPIRDFTLRIKKSIPEEIVSMCFPGKFVKTDPETLESHLTDFSPTSELLIHFLDPTRGRVNYESNDGNPPQGLGLSPALSAQGARATTHRYAFPVE